MRKIKLYAGYYELFVTLQEIKEPYQLQGEFSSKTQLIKWLKGATVWGLPDVESAEVVYIHEDLDITDTIAVLAKQEQFKINENGQIEVNTVKGFETDND